VVGVHVEHPTSIATHDLSATGGRIVGIETKERHRPTPRIGQRSQLGGSRAGQMGHQRRADRPPPPARPGEHGPDRPARLEVEALERVDRAEDLGDIGTSGLQVEGDVIPLTVHHMAAAREPMSVDLVPVSESGLGHAPSLLHLGDEPTDVEQIIAVETTRVLGDDSAEEDPSETRSGVDREHEMSEGDPTRRLNSPRVEHLELGQDHGANVPVGRGPVAVSAKPGSDPGATDVAEILRGRGDPRGLELGVGEG